MRRWSARGGTGLFVYRVGLGTMQFGWSIDEAGSFDVLDAYAEVGGDFIDTADVYSSWSSSMGGPTNAGGVSEEIVGRWIAERGNRDDLVIATKVRGAMGEMFSEGRDTAHQRGGIVAAVDHAGVRGQPAQARRRSTGVTSRCPTA